jgi:lysophospholipase L1-like esterase
LNFLDKGCNMAQSITRRTAIGGMASAAAAGAINATIPQTARANALPPASQGVKLQQGSRILFQGDSITDAGRDKSKQDEANDFDMLGKGYVKVAAYYLLAKYADLKFKIYNRGISGNKVPDLAARWDADCIDLKPDVLSILVGINDYWHTVAFGNKYQGTAEDYQRGYTELLARTKQALPDVQIVVCEPFALRDNWVEVLKPRRAGAQAAAESVGALWVPYQAMFDAAVAAGSPGQHWLWDGVHPTEHGQGLMAALWLSATGLA